MIEKIIRASDREHPADVVLRETLKAQRELFPGDRRAVTEAVFGWNRWRNWIEQSVPIPSQIDIALELAERFANEPESFADEELLALAVPDWLSQTMEIPPPWLRALQTPPKLWLRARRGQGRMVSLELNDCEAYGEPPLSDTLEYFGQQDLFRTPEFHEGKFELQDISSQAVGLICAPRSGHTWWDACAGEGGKLLHLSSLMDNKGLIWASDTAEWRLKKLKRRTARAKAFNYRSALWDGGPRLPTKTKFDGVLLDAPCSGVGTWHRNPHARWTLTAHDVTELAALQSNLLAHASVGVKPGGRLIYSVCTMTRAETTDVANAFENRFPEFKPEAFTDPLERGAKPVTRLQYWPQQCGGTGMFVACWTRQP